MSKHLRRLLPAAALVFLVSLGVFFLYISDAYEPTPEALTAFESTDTVLVEENASYHAFLPAQPTTSAAVIFYQGGKVEEEAYAPLMHQLAENGVPAYLMDLTFNLAFFDADAAQEVMDAEDDIHSWYLAGHSLGGVAASAFAADAADELAGLIFLASYPAADLTGTDLPVLSIYGDQDTVLDEESFSESTAHLPTVEVVVLEGGNHAQFGDYGEQEGDGIPEISAQKQQSLTIEAILHFISETSSYDDD